MNESKLTFFRSLIETRLAELAKDIALGQQGQAVVELDQQAVGRLSRMDALQSQAMAKAQQQRRDISVQRLQMALNRFEQDEYGACEDCGEWIAQKRLELDPAATKCISCASG